VRQQRCSRGCWLFLFYWAQGLACWQIIVTATLILRMACHSCSRHEPCPNPSPVPATQARIERAGGMLLNNGGLRLMGMLATTRAIGDHDLQPYGLTPEPEVMHLPRTPEDEFLVRGGRAGTRACVVD
jgi:hypothetical protein